MSAFPKFFISQFPEVEELLRQRNLQFPLASKDEFIAQMTAHNQPVVFRKILYDPHFAAELMPEFFFPIESEADMLQKGVELMIARGLFSRPEQPANEQ